MEKPLLLIDVDGVLNPTASRSSLEHLGFRRYSLQGYRVYLNRQHGDWLNSLSDRFELTWATTWEDDANRDIGPRIGLPRLPVINFDWQNSISKVPSIKAFVGDRAFAWIDDDMWQDAHQWAAERGLERTLLIDVDARVGLTTEHIDRLAEWHARTQ
jgi:hypothetical protein